MLQLQQYVGERGLHGGCASIATQRIACGARSYEGLCSILALRQLHHCAMYVNRRRTGIRKAEAQWSKLHKLGLIRSTVPAPLDLVLTSSITITLHRKSIETLWLDCQGYKEMSCLCIGSAYAL